MWDSQSEDPESEEILELKDFKCKCDCEYKESKTSPLVFLAHGLN